MSRPGSHIPLCRLLALVASTTGCLPDAVARDADASALRATVVIVDSLGREQFPSASCRRPRIVLRGPSIAESDHGSLLLIVGEPDDVLLEDARRRPLTASTSSRALPVRITTVDDTTTIAPRDALRPGARVSLVVPSFLLGTNEPPLVMTLDVASTEAGATLVDAFPPDGSPGLGTTIGSIDLGFDDAIEELASIVLVDDTGALVPTEPAPLDCALAGLVATHCVRLRVTASLSADARHSIDCTALRDRNGDAVCDAPLTFTTTTDPIATVPIAVACALDEREAASACLLEQDETVTLRARVSGLARLTFRLDGRSRVAISRSGDAVLSLDALAPDTPFSGALVLEDAVGHRIEHAFDVRTAPRLPHVVIGEIRADALGPEPAQEFVELWNLDDGNVDLGGFRIADAPDREGDALPSPFVVPRGGVALVVADAFDASNPLDVPPPPGALLARVGASIASSGLTNSGEPLFLRDTAGRRVTQAPPVATPRAGVCIARDASAPWSRDGTTYAPSSLGCTPGVR